MWPCCPKESQSGVEIVSDGEPSKISCAIYVKDRYTGFDDDSLRNGPEDLKQVSSFCKRLADESGTPQYARPICVSEIWFTPVRAVAIASPVSASTRCRKKTTNHSKTGSNPQFYVTYPQVRGILCFKLLRWSQFLNHSQHRSISKE